MKPLKENQIAAEDNWIVCISQRQQKHEGTEHLHDPHGSINYIQHYQFRNFLEKKLNLVGSMQSSCVLVCLPRCT